MSLVMTWRGFKGWQTSLQWRVLLATLTGLAVALALAWVMLNSLFRDHATQAFQADLQAHLEQLTARLEFDAQGQPQIDATTLSDPRWQKPYSGRYWQLDARRTAGGLQSGVLRSRSLWDQALSLPNDVVPDGAVHMHQLTGPTGEPVLALERSVRATETRADVWTLVVAADARDTQRAIDHFGGALAASLGVLLVLLGLAAVAQVWFGLAPLRALQQAVADLGEGRTTRLQGHFPAEIQPLADDFNRTLQRQEDGLARARTQAGNLAHALKTPLAVMLQAAQSAATAGPPSAVDELASLVREQVARARQHVDWHLSHARASASARVPGIRAEVAPAVAGLFRVMARVHVQRGLHLAWAEAAPGLAFAGEVQDLQEMLGNLIDNACQWAHTQVSVSAGQRLPMAPEDGAMLTVVVADDGPGIPPAHRQDMLTRGARLDEAVPGSGLGLAIVADLAALYGGQLTLAQSELGGLAATLTLPLAPPRSPDGAPGG
jgi:signal transduction histidine kinase